MSKYVVLSIATVLLLVFAATSAWAETPAQFGEVPDGTLARLGLDGMQRVSDAEGEQIRGGNVTDYLQLLGTTPLYFPSWNPQNFSQLIPTIVTPVLQIPIIQTPVFQPVGSWSWTLPTHMRWTSLMPDFTQLNPWIPGPMHWSSWILRPTQWNPSTNGPTLWNSGVGF